MNRPYPEQSLLNEIEDVVAPSDELSDWVRSTFIDSDASLANPDHEHLQFARIGFLWTNAANTRQMKDVVGQAELAKPPQSLITWQKVRWFQQVREWFRGIPDFIITLYAPYATQVNDATFCALIEHELYHCAQAKDVWGFPKFHRETGLPIFGIRGHDVEEFVGVVSRYGVNAGAGESKAFVEAAKRMPIVKGAEITGACGTCQLRIA